MGSRSIAGRAQATPPHPPPTNTLHPVHPLSRWKGGSGARERMYEGESVGRGWVGWSCLSSPRYRPPTPLVTKEIPLKIIRNKKKLT